MRTWSIPWWERRTSKSRRRWKSCHVSNLVRDGTSCRCQSRVLPARLCSWSSPTPGWTASRSCSTWRSCSTTTPTSPARWGASSYRGAGHILPSSLLYLYLSLSWWSAETRWYIKRWSKWATKYIYLLNQLGSSNNQTRISISSPIAPPMQIPKRSQVRTSSLSCGRIIPMLCSAGELLRQRGHGHRGLLRAVCLFLWSRIVLWSLATIHSGERCSFLVRLPERWSPQVKQEPDLSSGPGLALSGGHAIAISPRFTILHHICPLRHSFDGLLDQAILWTIRIFSCSPSGEYYNMQNAGPTLAQLNSPPNNEEFTTLKNFGDLDSLNLDLEALTGDLLSGYPSEVKTEYVPVIQQQSSFMSLSTPYSRGQSSLSTSVPTPGELSYAAVIAANVQLFQWFPTPTFTTCPTSPMEGPQSARTDWPSALRPEAGSAPSTGRPWAPPWAPTWSQPPYQPAPRSPQAFMSFSPEDSSRTRWGIFQAPHLKVHVCRCRTPSGRGATRTSSSQQNVQSQLVNATPCPSPTRSLPLNSPSQRLWRTCPWTTWSGTGGSHDRTWTLFAPSAATLP